MNTTTKSQYNPAHIIGKYNIVNGNKQYYEVGTLSVNKQCSPTTDILMHWHPSFNGGDINLLQHFFSAYLTQKGHPINQTGFSFDTKRPYNAIYWLRKNRPINYIGDMKKNYHSSTVDKIRSFNPTCIYLRPLTPVSSKIEQKPALVLNSFEQKLFDQHKALLVQISEFEQTLSPELLQKFKQISQPKKFNLLDIVDL